MSHFVPFLPFTMDVSNYSALLHCLTQVIYSDPFLEEEIPYCTLGNSHLIAQLFAFLIRLLSPRLKSAKSALGSRGVTPLVVG